ncbi:unnamed protein product [Camellia sinensis]
MATAIPTQQQVQVVVTRPMTLHIGGASGSGEGGFANASLYVGDLDPTMNTKVLLHHKQIEIFTNRSSLCLSISLIARFPRRGVVSSVDLSETITI